MKTGWNNNDHLHPTYSGPKIKKSSPLGYIPHMLAIATGLYQKAFSPDTKKKGKQKPGRSKGFASLIQIFKKKEEMGKCKSHWNISDTI